MRLLWLRVLTASIAIALGIGAATAMAASASSLTYTAPAGGDARLTIERAGADLVVRDDLSNLVVARANYAATTGVEIHGAAGQSTSLTIDLSQGPIALPILYAAGVGGDNSLTLQGGPPASEIYAPTSAHDGTIVLGATAITYQNLTPISDTVPAASYTFNATSAAEQINIVDGPIISGIQTTEINSGTSATFEKVDFANKTSVTVNGNGGADTITVNNPTPAQGLSTLTVQTSSNATSTVNVLQTAASVATTVFGNDAVNLNIGNAGSVQGILGSVASTNPPNFTTVTVDDSADPTARTSIYTSSGGNDTLTGLAPATLSWVDGDTNTVTVEGGTGGNTDTIAGVGVGLTFDTGTGQNTVVVQKNGGQAVQVIGQGSQDTVTIGGTGGVQNINGGGVTVTGKVGGSTTLTLDDSADSTGRTATVTGAQTTGLAPSTLAYANVGTLSILGGSGSDTFNVTPSSSTGMSFDGGLPAPPTLPGDTLNFNLSGITNPQINTTSSASGYAGTATFGNAQTITFSKIETLSPASTPTPTSTPSPTFTPTSTNTPASTNTPTNTATPTFASTPGAGFTVVTQVANATVIVSVPPAPPNTTPIVGIVVSTPSVPPAITPTNPQFQSQRLIDVTALDANRTSVEPLAAPITISIRFTPQPGVNAQLAQIYTIDSNGNGQALPTTVTANSDGSYTMTVVTSHVSPFQVFAPPVGARVPQLIFPYVYGPGGRYG